MHMHTTYADIKLSQMARMVATKAALSIRVDALADVDEKSGTTAATIGIENRAKLESRLRALEHQSDLGSLPFASSSRKQSKFEMTGATKQYNTAADSVGADNMDLDPIPTERTPTDAAVAAVVDVKEERRKAKEEKKRAKEEKRAKKEAKQAQEAATEEVDDEAARKEKKRLKKEAKKAAAEAVAAVAAEEEAAPAASSGKEKKQKKRRVDEGESPEKKVSFSLYEFIFMYANYCEFVVEKEGGMSLFCTTFIYVIPVLHFVLKSFESACMNEH